MQWFRIITMTCTRIYKQIFIKYLYLDLRLDEVADQCLILSNIVEPQFPGKLWCCLTCKKDGMMSSNTKEEVWVKQHKNCKLFMKSCLSVKPWGRTALDRNGVLYAYPKDLKQSLVVTKKR